MINHQINPLWEVRLECPTVDFRNITKRLTAKAILYLLNRSDPLLLHYYFIRGKKESRNTVYTPERYLFDP